MFDFPRPFSESLVFLIGHDDVPWCGAFVVVHGAGQCICVETGHSYPSVLAYCLIFLTIFFFFVVVQLPSLLDCSSDFLIFSLLFPIALSFVVVLFPDKFQLYPSTLLLNFYFYYILNF